MMSFALLKKAFGIGKAIDDREFDDFLKAVDVNDVHVGFDPVKPTPTINVGRQQLNLSDMAFGSYSLNNRKPLLHSMKIHDMSGLCPNKACSQKSHSRRNFYHLFNTDVSHHNQLVPQSSADTSLKISAFTARRFYNMLFEHWVQLSLIIETLSNECAIAVCSSAKSYWGTHKLVPESHCTETIAKAFSNFLNYFRDLCLPKLYFPIWPTLNVTLSTDFDSLSPCSDRSRADCVAYWLNMDPSYSQSMIADSNQVSKDSLLDVFVRSCLAPLIIKGNSKEHRSFLARLITGILMFHTGWIDGSGSRSNPVGFQELIVVNL
ncbi:unnamed protein product [Schistosoma mattheei]|uniref:Folliculin-interacting protein middle domain-containing protein n=1 Tax=Schistosoma mattheei TaxID=31246 RepID=A0A3P7XMZ3_9TREM|nr:unnamed protein product [Schistosoma mattheei]